MKKYYLYNIIAILLLCSCGGNGKIYKDTIVTAFETNPHTEVRTDLKIKFIEFSNSDITVSDSITILEEQINKIQKDIETLREKKSNSIFSSKGKEKRLKDKLQINENKLREYKEVNYKDVIAIKINCKFSYQEFDVSARKETKKELILSPDGRKIYYIMPHKNEQKYLDYIDSVLDM